MQKKVYLIMFLVIAFALTAWSVSPAQSSGAQYAPEQTTTECRSGAESLTGSLASIERVQNRVRQICDFNVRMTRLDSNISDLDRHFVEHSIAGNMLELEALEIALQGVQNEELRGLIQMMIPMHRHDLEMAMEAAERLGLNTAPDLTEAHVFPGTPEYDLGMREVDLVAKFLTPLRNAAGVPVETPTAVPTYMTGTVTTVPTDVTGTATGVPTDATGTVTSVPTDVTGTATAPATTATGTATLVPATGTTVSSPTAVATDTLTAIASPTALVTTTPGSGAMDNFDMVALHILEDIHVMHVETALAAQRLVENDEIRAFAKHAADGAGLHLILMSDLKHRLFDNYTPPPPDFQREYQGPRQFGPGGNE
jgi:hypothetical protein